MFAELSGALLSALLARNARFAGRADFLYLAPGVSYALRPRGGGALPTNGFEKEELDEGALEAVPSSISVWGAPLDTCERGWYKAVVSDYILDTLLKDVPERQHGVRGATPLGLGEREVVRAFLQGGGELSFSSET